MSEIVDHQTHYKNLVEQHQTLSNEIENKKKLLMKITGAIEYLEEIGVTLPSQNDSTSETTTEVEVAS